MVAAALVVSLLGALTSTQLMSQARNARTFPSVFIWTVLGCLTFGFCGVWCLHFLGMLSCEFDVAIGLNPFLTILSAVLAVFFTFGALSTHLVQKYQRRLVQKHFDVEGPVTAVDHHLGPELGRRESLERPLRSSLELSWSRTRTNLAAFTTDNGPSEWTGDGDIHDGTTSTGASDELERPLLDSIHSYGLHSNNISSTAVPQSRSLLHNTPHETGTMRTSRQRKNIISACSAPTLNTLLITANVLLNGLTFANVVKGFVWSIALTNMHFMGVKAMDIPGGFVSLDPLRVMLCALISWSVCCVGVILMAGMEVNLKQQVVFSVVAATGVAAVHFSGMHACSFWSTEAPASSTSYPIELPVTIASVALLTCLASTGLLAHSATVTRDKLTDVLYTRRRLWAAITQKENAESAAAAKGQFIASASHEIRTPLHQLQGYADLLAQSELSEEDRRLLHAIQLATRSLAMS
ncbi:hypothetical protein N7476_003900 [Penicillium atrosanguineum]|uniref:Signal transduction histidine kinase dimerisation/phosphoacceptor domain-containing protein n=1 Tax=Penicillium atrosanguineum TaxID=1132637 RepID=A0A9W9Q118_9EURO|nr:hypothetical protein N7476_003900 [Penicillium atrosanguineum]